MMRPADLRTEGERGGIRKLIGKTKFPANFSEKVDMSKVNMETMVPWIQAEVEKYVGFDDDVLVGYVQSQLAPPDGSPVDPRAVQLNLMGFLEKHTSSFMAELWTLLLSAQRHPMGIPEEFIERKREEIREKKVEAARVLELLREKRAEVERQMAAEKARRLALEKRDWPEPPKPTSTPKERLEGSGDTDAPAVSGEATEAGAGTGLEASGMLRWEQLSKCIQ